MPGKSSKTVPFTVRLPSELVERIKERAAKDGLSVAAYLQQRLEGERVYTPTPEQRPVYTPAAQRPFTPFTKAMQANPGKKVA